jgi:NADH-quinone oxidoreductase subunit M
MLSERRHTRLIADYGGLKGVVPRLTAVFLILTLSSIGLPSLNGFIGEFLVLLGAFVWDWRFAAVATSGVILSAVYMLWMVQRVYYGEVTHEENRQMPDLSPREWAVISPVVAMAVVMGIFPNVFLAPTAPAIDKLVQRVAQTRQVNVRHARPALPSAAAAHSAGPGTPAGATAFTVPLRSAADPTAHAPRAVVVPGR